MWLWGQTESSKFLNLAQQDGPTYCYQNHTCHIFPRVLYWVFCFDINVLVSGDLRHEYAQSTWGFLFRGPPGSWLHSLRLHCGDWRFLWWWLLLRDEYHCDTHNVLMTSLLHLSARPPCGSDANCHGFPHCVRWMLILWALWHFTMMALIASIAISKALIFDCAHRDWRWHLGLLLLAPTVPSFDACIVFTARIFNSLITIQTELSFY